MESTKRQPTQAALAARMVRKELKEKFKGVKFSVTSENYSMGSSLDVSWFDGPTQKEVERIVRKYEMGSFNGMEDIYEYDNKADHPQVKYAFADREYSTEVLEAAFNDLKKTNLAYETCNSLTDYLDPEIIGELIEARNDIIINYLSKCELYNGYEKQAIDGLVD